MYRSLQIQPSLPVLRRKGRFVFPAKLPKRRGARRHGCFHRLAGEVNRKMKRLSLWRHQKWRPSWSPSRIVLKIWLNKFSVKVKITMHDKCRIGIKFAISFLPFFFHFIFLLFFFLFLIFPKKRKKNKWTNKNIVIIILKEGTDYTIGWSPNLGACDKRRFW